MYIGFTCYKVNNSKSYDMLYKEQFTHMLSVAMHCCATGINSVYVNGGVYASRSAATRICELAYGICNTEPTTDVVRRDHAGPSHFNNVFFNQIFTGEKQYSLANCGLISLSVNIKSLNKTKWFRFRLFQINKNVIVGFNASAHMRFARKDTFCHSF